MRTASQSGTVIYLHSRLRFQGLRFCVVDAVAVALAANPFKRNVPTKSKSFFLS